jgi:hypothetical protein
LIPYLIKSTLTKLSAAVEKRMGKLEDKIISKSKKNLTASAKTGRKDYERQLSSKDSVEAKLKLAEIQGKYNELKEKLRNPSAFDPSSIKQYIPHLDTLNSALKFLIRIIQPQMFEERLQRLNLSMVDSNKRKTLKILSAKKGTPSTGA